MGFFNFSDCLGPNKPQKEKYRQKPEPEAEAFVRNRAGIHQPDAGKEREVPMPSQPSLATAEKTGGSQAGPPTPLTPCLQPVEAGRVARGARESGRVEVAPWP